MAAAVGGGGGGGGGRRGVPGLDVLCVQNVISFLHVLCAWQLLLLLLLNPDPCFLIFVASTCDQSL